jgi:hypothetical protein
VGGKGVEAEENEWDGWDLHEGIVHWSADKWIAGFVKMDRLLRG